MAQGPSRAVLITGCSSGIGEATARHLAARDWTVYATARRRDSLEGLAAAGCRTLALDVTDEDSMSAAVGEVEQAEGAVGVLVNNAGYSQSGPIEQVPMDDVRRQFETNVFGLVRMCQLVLPGMRRQRFGKVVNLSSMGGKFVFPGGGFYHATKFAVEAISDALRFEVGGFGVDVIVIEPGLIRTRFSATAVGAMPDGARSEGGATAHDVPGGATAADARGGATATAPADDPYAELNRVVARATEEAYEKGMLARLGGPPEAVARVIEKAITSARPRARYRVTPSAHLLVGQRRLLSDGLWDRMLRTQFPQPE